MERLTKQEFNLAKDIIDQGLNKAAESLSFFMKESITLKDIDFNISDDQNFPYTQSLPEDLHVLTTELRGDLKGKCFLVFTNTEKDELCRVALPSEIFNNSDKLKTMQEPLLLEVDNIISASVITKIANSLNIKIYGDVPGLSIMGSEVFREYFIQQTKPDKLIMGLKTEFISSKSHFHPEFLWILEPEFLNCVKRTFLEKIQ